ncbi:glycosyltransferase [Oscillatoria sp. CS-180]|uniref:glycosyltransferase family 2 protein n=1 Tax=Oscillatoria sp. CS-180 TaxID=3021720 RepID=UPI00232C324E|nr:glycosyltransferase [Oscillatoria sp. CS-180]MDB9527259.1 glycosyltransferase [Oscillatoria sp. CS-180]
MKSNITLIVSPRERFSHTQKSLESIYENTQTPFNLVYVDGGSPRSISNYLQKQSAERGFELVRTESFLAPNQARNLGLAAVDRAYPDTQYVVFIDNDVEVAPDWLKPLADCAEATHATVVCPLTCIGQPLGDTIHLAGGEARIVLQIKGEKKQRRVHEKHYFVNRPVTDVQDQLHRRQCEFAEFHCMMVRRSLFDIIGPLDENLISTREHIDFCLTLAQVGGTVYCEPASVVTYVPEVLFRWSDLAYFMLRWSDEWEIRSLKYFRKKWDLPKKDKYFRKRYQRLGYRRHQAFIKPWVKRFLWGQAPPSVMKFLITLDRQINHWVTDRYYRLHPERENLPQPPVFSAAASRDRAA